MTGYSILQCKFNWQYYWLILLCVTIYVLAVKAEDDGTIQPIPFSWCVMCVDYYWPSTPDQPWQYCVHGEPIHYLDCSNWLTTTWACDNSSSIYCIIVCWTTGLVFSYLLTNWHSDTWCQWSVLLCVTPVFYIPQIMWRIATVLTILVDVLIPFTIVLDLWQWPEAIILLDILMILVMTCLVTAGVFYGYAVILFGVYPRLRWWLMYTFTIGLL